MERVSLRIARLAGIVAAIDHDSQAESWSLKISRQRLDNTITVHYNTTEINSASLRPLGRRTPFILLHLSIILRVRTAVRFKARCEASIPTIARWVDGILIPGHSA